MPKKPSDIEQSRYLASATVGRSKCHFVNQIRTGDRRNIQGLQPACHTEAIRRSCAPYVSEAHMRCGMSGQARDRYPVVLIRSGDVAETLHTMRPTPLRHGDVICIADECFLFERIARPASPQDPKPSQPTGHPSFLSLGAPWASVDVNPCKSTGGQPPAAAAQAGGGAAGAPDAAGGGVQAGDDGAAGVSDGSDGAGLGGKVGASAGQASGGAAGGECGLGAGGSCGGRMALSAAGSDGGPGSDATAGMSSGAGALQAAGASHGSAPLGLAGSCLAVPRHAQHEC